MPRCSQGALRLLEIASETVKLLSLADPSKHDELLALNDEYCLVLKVRWLVLASRRVDSAAFTAGGPAPTVCSSKYVVAVHGCSGSCGGCAIHIVCVRVSLDGLPCRRWRVC